MEYDHQGFVDGGDGTRLFYGVRGTGEPTLVLNDGVACDGFAWRYLQPALAQHHCVVHCHYRGHGRSGAPMDPQHIGVTDLVDDLQRVLDHLNISSAVLLGHSMGTQVALEYYRADPARVAGLVLLCGAHGQITHHFQGTNVLDQVLPTAVSLTGEFRSASRALWGRIPASIAFRFAQLWGQVDPNNLREDDFRQYWEHAALMDPDLFLRMLASAGEHDASDLLPSIKVPTLVVAAERDTFTPLELTKTMAHAIPGAEFMMIREGSHAAPVEQPELIQERIEAFLAALSSQP